MVFAEVQPVYLDFNSTTPLAPSVREAMEPFWTEHFMLPGQGHRGCQAVADAIDRAREQLAGLIGCESYELVFTGGGTEANNLAILGALQRQTPGHVIATELEHDSVWQTVDSLRLRGWQVDFVRPNTNGVIEVAAIESMIRPDTRLVCMQAANGVLGTVQPVREVADLCHIRGIRLHCDAAQALGKTVLNCAELRADTVAISAHKMYGPKGVGALFVRRGLDLNPIVSGEAREMGLRPGTENVAGWIGFGAAARLAQVAVAEALERMRELRDLLATRVQESLGAETTTICRDADRLSNTLILRLPVDSLRVARAARQLVLAVPRGETHGDEITRCLRAIGMPHSDIRRCCRVSIGLTTSRDQIEKAAELLAEACEIQGTV